MSYQPNDFVNPHHRGMELPAGCKDLYEVLQKLGAHKQTARPIFPLRHGSLKDVPRYVQEVYLMHYGSSLAVIVRAAEAILWVHNRHTGCRLNFMLRNQHTNLAQVVRDLFGSGGFHEEASEKLSLIKAPLPHLWLDAAQIVQSVIRGYGVG